ncbi:MAG: hypothetical protein M3357_00335 [Actinomycetota bacterium]|nr:hypothetical protein [Actinomycetota bacterium]
MRRIPQLLLLPLAATAGVLVPSVASAEIPPGACDAVFAGEPDVRLALRTDPPARSEASPGQTVAVTIGWSAGNWDSLNSMLVCVRIVDTFHPEMSLGEDVPLNDGEGFHSFVVPQGLPRGTFVCTQAQLSGDPAGEATGESMVSKKSCLEVHPDAQEPPANNPSPTPPPTAAPTPPPPAPAPAPQPSSPPSQGAGSAHPPTPVPSQVNPPTPVPVAAPGTVSESSPPLIVERPAGAPVRPGGPIHLDELPRTGAALGWLAVAGFGALSLGVPAVAVGRRRLRR